MKRTVFAVLLTVFAFSAVSSLSAQTTTQQVIYTGGATISDIYRTKKAAEVEARNAGNQRHAEDNRHTETMSGQSKQSAAIEGDQDNQRNQADNQHQETLYRDCLQNNQPNCSEILFGRSGGGSIRNNADPENNLPMALILDNETGHSPCIQSPGQTFNEGGSRVDNCQGITVPPRQWVVQSWETYGVFKANLQRDELQMLGTDRGGCTGDVTIILQKKRNVTDRNGHHFPVAMFGIITQNDITNCSASLNVSRNTDGDTRVVHIKRQKN